MPVLMNANMAALKQIEEFLSCPVIAVAGVSRNPKKFGYSAFKELLEKGMNAIPVNPSADEIMGVKAFRDISSLPDEVTGLIILTARDQTVSVVKEARLKGIKTYGYSRCLIPGKLLRNLKEPALMSLKENASLCITSLTVFINFTVHWQNCLEDFRNKKQPADE